jgi:hypothetical protein
MSLSRKDVFTSAIVDDNDDGVGVAGNSEERRVVFGGTGFGGFCVVVIGYD